MALTNRDLRVLLTTIGQVGMREEDLLKILEYRFAREDIRLGLQQLLASGQVYYNSKRQLFRRNR